MSPFDATYSRHDPYDDPVPDVAECLDYWERLRGGHFAPNWQDFDWTEIPSELVPHCGVVDVRTDPLDFVYRYWGTAHVQAHGQELTWKSVTEMRPEAEGASVFAQYKETYDARKPVLFVNEIVAGKYELPMLETSLRLPFSDDGESVTHLMAFSDIRKDLDRLQGAFTGTQD